MPRTELPIWAACSAKINANEDLSPLEQFIHDNEPAEPDDTAIFRTGLQALLDEY